jgi:hypothetical protein
MFEIKSSKKSVSKIKLNNMGVTIYSLQVLKMIPKSCRQLKQSVITCLKKIYQHIGLRKRESKLKTKILELL